MNYYKYRFALKFYKNKWERGGRMIPPPQSPSFKKEGEAARMFPSLPLKRDLIIDSFRRRGVRACPALDAGGEVFERNLSPSHSV